MDIPTTVVVLLFFCDCFRSAWVRCVLYSADHFKWRILKVILSNTYNNNKRNGNRRTNANRQRALEYTIV